MTTCLLEKRGDGVALITLNRPERMNALVPELSASLRQFVAECEADRAVRCIAITGAGRAFCAGADVGNMQRSADAAAHDPGLLAKLDDRIRELRERHTAIGLRLHTMAKPTVAIVNGYAIGAGFALACACDIRLAGSEAKLSTGFANTATTGDGGGTFFLTKLVNSGVARELCFDPAHISAQRARELGIVNHVYPQDRLMDEALAFCAKLAAGPTAAFGRMKENLNLAWHATGKEAIDLECANIVYSMQGNDHREAVRAFMEKREPKFTGT
jgi:2-(1,2-epoxy-1,2-dihydrophenyl)acetyl-CoA isomerase